MKARLKNIIIFIAFFLPWTGRTQINLVLNPNFEQYSICPYTANCATFCTNWVTLDSAWRAPDWTHDKNGVPEYVNKCASFGPSSVPSNFYFYQFPHSGNGMMQVMTYTEDSDTTYARDYLQGHLSRRLTAGNKYYVTFFTVLEEEGGYATSHIGAYLDDGTIDTTQHPDRPQTHITPQIVDTSIITDTFNWIKVEGTFVANGTEHLITIGNFRDKAHTNYQHVYGGTALGWAWYLVDDVSVIDCDNIPFAGRDTMIHPGDSAWIGPHESLLPYTWYKLGSSAAIDSGGGTWVKPTVTTTYVLEQKLCGRLRYDTVKVRVWPDTSLMVNGELLMVNVRVYPNPVADEVTIEVASAKGLAMTGFDVVLYDVVGREIYKGIVNDKLLIVNVESLPKGVYFVQVTDRETSVKLVKKVLKE